MMPPPPPAGPYSFSAVLSGHSSDVRCLAPLPPSASASAAPGSSSLATGSRDQLAKVWRTTQESKDREWAEDRAFEKHERYVTAVAARAPCEAFQEGLVS